MSCSDPTAKQKIEAGTGYQATVQQASLVIDAGTMTGGVTYTFTVTGKMSYDTTVQADASLVVKAKSSPLEAAIAGGECYSHYINCYLLPFLFSVREKVIQNILKILLDPSASYPS